MLERSGRARVTYVSVDRDGIVDPDDVAAALTDKTVLVSIMHANNEIGTIQSIGEIAKVAHERGSLFHTDATQSVGCVEVDVEAMGIDLLSMSAHKIYGPKGCGALYVRARQPRVRLKPILHGGGHERGLRSGTLNVPGVVGMGLACEIAGRQRDADVAHLLRLRERLHTGLASAIDDLSLNGHPERRLPGNLNLSLPYVEGESLLMALEDIAVSSGSACTSASLEPSHVLKALGIPDGTAQSSIRFGIGRGNTEEEIDYATERVAAEVKRLRALSPEFRMRARA
jgi:cysteine desulfurase